jgi:hypothetical protein
MGLGWTHKWKFQMKSIYTTKKKCQLMLIKWKWCGRFSKHKLYTAPQPLGGSTTPFPIIYSMPLCGDYVQMSLFPKIRTLIILKLWMLISFSNQVCFENAREIYYILKKIFPMVYNIAQSNLMGPSRSKDLWSIVKFSIWFPPLLMIITHANLI